MIQTEGRGFCGSGGGNKGAFIVGVLEYLQNKEKINLDNYQILGGNSTSSLIIQTLSLNKLDDLINVYTNVSNKDIFKYSPTFQNGWMNPFNMLYNLIKIGSLGDSENLFKLLQKYFTYKDYLYIKSINKNIIVAVCNLTYEVKEFYSINNFANTEEGYTKYLRLVWSSANNFPFMSVYNDNGVEYVDGGYAEHIPLENTVQLCHESNIKEMDVILTRPLPEDFDKLPKKLNFLKRIGSLFGIWKKEVSFSDVRFDIKKAKELGIKLNIYYPRKEIKFNPLVFNSKKMTEWYNMGKNGEFKKRVIN